MRRCFLIDIVSLYCLPYKAACDPDGFAIQTHWTLNVDYTSTVLDVLGKVCSRIGVQAESLGMYEREGVDPSTMPASPSERRLQYTGPYLTRIFANSLAHHLAFFVP